MEYKLLVLSAEAAKIAILAIPKNKLGRETNPDTIALRRSLEAFKVGKVGFVEKGEAKEVEVYKDEKQSDGKKKRVGTGKMRTVYPVITQYQTAIKVVNNSTTDGSKLFLIKAVTEDMDEYYLVRVSADDLNNKKYQVKTKRGTFFSITEWRKEELNRK